MKKEYTTPRVTTVGLQVEDILTASGDTKPGGLTGNVDGTDEVIGNGGDDNDGREGDAKENPFDLWAD